MAALSRAMPRGGSSRLLGSLRCFSAMPQFNYEPLFQATGPLPQAKYRKVRRCAIAFFSLLFRN